MDIRGLAVLGIMLAVEFCCVANANLVLPVQRKFRGPLTSLNAIKAHDARRRGRFLSAVDVELGGNGLPSASGLYYTKLGLGTPPKDFYVHVDTGSDILWVNCAGCSSCPKKSDLGITLTPFDRKDSNTSYRLPCDHVFCNSAHDGPIPVCKQNMSCSYNISYGDGSTTSGFYVQDYLTFNRVNGNLQTTPDNSSVIFGCSDKQSGRLGSSTNEALDGIIGFGQANSSVLS